MTYDYLKEYQDKIPDPLPHDEQRALFRRFKDEGDTKAAARLIETNLGLVFVFMRKLKDAGDVEYLDLLQAGNQGLCEALENYNPKKGKFTTYARWHILRRMYELIRQSRSAMSLGTSSNVSTVLAKTNQIRAGFYHEHQREPTHAELSEILGVSPEIVSRVLKQADGSPVSLDKIPGGARRPVDEEDTRVLLDYIEAPGQTPERAAAKGEITAILEAFGETLARPMDRAIWYDRLIADDPMTHQQISDKIGRYTKQWIQVSTEALKEEFLQWCAYRGHDLDEILDRE